MEQQDLEEITKDYLQAVDSRDMSRCLEFFAEDACIHFMEGVFNGKEQIREYHQERLDANFRIAEVEGIKCLDDAVEIAAVITSDRLAAWRIESLSGTSTLRFQDGKIKEMSFALRVYNPLEGW
jgi:hypothetical protein